MKKHLSLAALLFSLTPLFIAAPVIADDLDDGKALYKKQDYKNAYSALEKSARSGNAEAQFLVGYMNEEGEGTKKSAEDAVKWYLKSAGQGHSQAQNNLAGLYQDGDGIKKNLTQAAKWYKAAADQGNVSALFNLGWLYSKGEGVDKDPVKAFELYLKAAEQGNVKAQFNVAVAYRKGNGVTTDNEKGMYWYRKAAENGDLTAQENLCGLYVQADKWDDAFKWCLMADKAGSDNPNVSSALGFIYLLPKAGQSIDNEKAFQYLSKSSEKGIGEADFALGSMYEYGLFVKEDRKKAIEYYEKAAAKGVKSAPAKLQKLK